MINIELERQINDARNRKMRLNLAVENAKKTKTKPKPKRILERRYSFDDHVKLWHKFNSSLLALKRLSRRYKGYSGEVYREVNPSIYSSLNPPKIENVLKEIAVKYGFEYQKLKNSKGKGNPKALLARQEFCLLYTSPSPRDRG